MLDTELNELPSEVRPLKIALVIASAETGGLLRITESLADQLCRDGHSVTVLSVTDGSPYLPTSSRKWRFESLHCKRVAAGFWRMRRLSVAKFDAIIVSQFYVGVILAFARPRRSKTAIVWVEHSSLELWRESDRVKDRIAERLARLACARVEVMTAVSATTTGAINRDFHRLRWPAIELANPVLDGTEPCFGDRNTNHALRNDILFVGRLSPEKRVDLLLEAYSTLQDRIDHNLVIIGDGPERATLQQMAIRLGCADRVEFRGTHPDPPSVMGVFTLLVLCSDYEGLGIVLIEALAQGCSVVSTDCPTGPREVLANGRFGRLVPVGDPAALANAIEQALDQPVEESDELALHLQKYTVRSATTAYREAIQAATDRRRSMDR